MDILDYFRFVLDLIVRYLNNAEARDKICRAIQFGSKFLSNGQPGTARNVEQHTSLARKVFRLFKFLKDFNSLISPVPNGTPLLLVLLKKSKNALHSTFLFLDQFVWLGRSGIYKNKEGTYLIRRISLFFWLGSCICSTAIAIVELGRLSSSTKKMEMEQKHQLHTQDDLYCAKLEKPNERILALIKSSMDIVVAIGVLKLAPKIVTSRVTGAFGFITSLISCYLLLPSRPKVKTP